MGKVTKIFPDSRGNVQSVQLKTKTGLLRDLSQSSACH